MSHYQTHHRSTSTLPSRFVLRPMVLAAHLAMVGGVVIGTSWGNQAHAQQAAPASGSQASSATSPRHYDIPAGPLNTVLVRFLSESGVLLSGSTELARGKNSPGVKGSYTPRAALAELLTGTGLEAKADAQGYYALRTAVVVSAPSSTISAPNAGVTTLAEVKVTAERADGLPAPYAGGQVARGGQLGMLGNTDLMDAPFNITSYTAGLIENQQARSVGDVLANDPSVRSASTAASPGEYLLIRGFAATEDSIAFNGLAGMGPNNRSSTEMVERVEVLKGPSAAISGMVPDGSVGGSVMLVPKRATDEPLTRIGLDYGTRSQLGTRVDLGRRFGENNAWGIRVNGVLRDGEGYVQGRDQRTGLGSVALDYRGERLRVALDAYEQSDKRDGQDYFVVFAGAPSAVPDASKPMTRGDWAKARDSMLMARVEYDLSSQITAFAAFGKRRYRSEWLRAMARDTDQSGTGTTRAYRERFNGDLSSAEAGLRARVNTGAISHRIALTATDFKRTNYYAALDGKYVSSNIFDPVVITDPGDPGQPPKIMRNQLKSVALADTLGLWDERLLLTLGLRRQQVSTVGGWSGWNSSAPTKESATSPIVALVFEPTPSVSLYANYVQGLTQGPVAPTYLGLDNAGEVFPPYKSQQYELGVKGEWNGLGSSLSLFQIAQPNSLIVGNRFTMDGEQRNWGVEWNFYGTPAKGVRVLGGLSLMNARVTKADGETQGKRAYSIPRAQLNLGGEWDVPGVNGLTLSGRVLYTGSLYIDSANLYSIPAWTRWDVGARYTTRIGGKTVVLRANIENLAGKSYWTGSYVSGYTSRGAPRTLLLSAAMDF